jgi:hypothetical protein
LFFKPSEESAVISGISSRDISPAAILLRIERSPIGLLVGQKGETSEITVIITAVGMIEEASHAAIYELPPEVSIAVASVAKDAAFWGESAASAGHTVLVESPMEPYNYPQVDPGELTLLTGAAYSDNINRLGRILEKVPSAKGISTYLGGKFLADRKALQPNLIQQNMHFFTWQIFVQNEISRSVWNIHLFCKYFQMTSIKITIFEHKKFFFEQMKNYWLQCFSICKKFPP